MSTPTDLVTRFQDLVATVPEVVQPLVVAAAGAVPFIEGEGAAAIGVIGGIHPVAAALAAAAGNFVCVVLVVVLGHRVRRAVVDRRNPDGTAPEPRSKGQAKFRRMLSRFGVPGASLLGPLALPTQFTSATLVATGVSKRRVIGWQAVAIALWTTVVTVVATGGIALAT